MGVGAGGAGGQVHLLRQGVVASKVAVQQLLVVRPVLGPHLKGRRVAAAAIGIHTAIRQETARGRTWGGGGGGERRGWRQPYTKLSDRRQPGGGEVGRGGGGRGGESGDSHTHSYQTGDSWGGEVGGEGGGGGGAEERVEAAIHTAIRQETARGWGGGGGWPNTQLPDRGQLSGHRHTHSYQTERGQSGGWTGRGGGWLWPQA